MYQIAGKPVHMQMLSNLVSLAFAHKLQLPEGVQMVPVVDKLNNIRTYVPVLEQLEWLMTQLSLPIPDEKSKTWTHLLQFGIDLLVVVFHSTVTGKSDARTAIELASYLDPPVKEVWIVLHNKPSHHIHNLTSDEGCKKAIGNTSGRAQSSTHRTIVRPWEFNKLRVHPLIHVLSDSARIATEEDKKKLQKKLFISKKITLEKQLPLIRENDPVVLWTGAKLGDWIIYVKDLPGMIPFEEVRYVIMAEPGSS